MSTDISRRNSLRNESMMAGSSNAPASGEQQWFVALKNGAKGAHPRFEAVLPKGFTADRFITSLGIYIRNRPELWGSDVGSIIESGLKAAQQGLDFGIPNEAHLVRFGNEVTLIRGYKGDLKMARRSSNISFVDANCVYLNDVMEMSLGSEPKLTHVPAKLGEDAGDIVGAYAVARDARGNCLFVTMSVSQAIAHYKKFTKAKNKGPFAKLDQLGIKHENFDAYIRKSCVLALCTQKLDLHGVMEGEIEREVQLMHGQQPQTELNVFDVTQEEMSAAKQRAIEGTRTTEVALEVETASAPV